MSPWRQSLRSATWRGLPFSVSSTEGVSGRRVQMHEYPFRDEPWAEDLGRRSRAFTIRGYLIGDDVAAQLAAFQEAAEQAGDGELVHPFRPTVDVTLIGMADHDAWEEGRIVRLILEFVETGERRFPAAIVNGAAEIASAATRLDRAAASVGAEGIGATLRSGVGGLQQIARTAQSYVATARGLMNSTLSTVRSVTAVLGVVPGLGRLTRFVGQGSTAAASALGRITSLTGGGTAVMTRITAARANVERLGATVVSLAGRL